MDRVDEATIDAARRGDRRAQARLLQSLQDVWYRYCLSMLRDAEKAADATQETALRFLKQLPAFRGDSQLQTWSVGIALNVVREQRRKSFRDETTSLNCEDGSDPDLAPERSSGGSTDAVEQEEQQTKMRSILNTLPDRQREAVTLRFFEELSVEETATAMGCAVGTVKATVHQALRALKLKMQQPS